MYTTFDFRSIHYTSRYVLRLKQYIKSIPFPIDTMKTIPTTVPKINRSPAGSDFSDSEWSLTFSDEEEKIRMLTPEPTLYGSTQRGSATPVDDGRYQSFHPNYQFTRDFTPRSTAGTYNSSGSRYLSDAYDCHRFHIGGGGTPPIQAVFDTLVLGHTSDKSWSSNQSYCLTASSKSSESSEFVSLPRPDFSETRPYLKDKTKIGEPLTKSGKAAEATGHLSSLADGHPIPSRVLQKNKLDGTTESKSLASVESVYVFLESRSDRHRASTIEGLFSDRGLNSSEYEREKLRSTLSRPPTSNSQRCSQIPVRIKPPGKNDAGECKNTTSAGKESVSKTGQQGTLRDNISSAESLYVFQESRSDRHRASTLEGLFSDTELTSDYDGGKQNKAPTIGKFKKRSHIPIKTKQNNSAAKRTYLDESSSDSSSESTYLFGGSGSDGYHARTLEGLWSDTEATSSDIEIARFGSAPSTPPRSRNSKKNSKIPLRITPLLQHKTFMDKIALICGSDTLEKGDKNRERGALIGRAPIELSDDRKKEHAEKNKKEREQKNKITSKAPQTSAKTAFQKRKEYEARRKDGSLNTEKKKPPRDKQERYSLIKGSTVVLQKSMERIQPANVQNKPRQNRNVYPAVSRADGLTVKASGVNLHLPNAPDKPNYRYVAATEQQVPSSLACKEQSAKHDYSLSDTSGYKNRVKNCLGGNVDPISFKESEQRNIAGARKIKNIQVGRDGFQPKDDKSVLSCLQFEKSPSPRHVLPPMSKHAGKNPHRHDEPRRERNTNVFPSVKRASNNQENFHRCARQGYKPLCYPHGMQQKRVPCKDVQGSVMVHPKKNIGYVPGYGSVRVYSGGNDINPVSSTREEIATHTSRNDQSCRKKEGMYANPVHGAKRAEFPASVKLPPITTREGSDNHRAKGKRKTQAIILARRAKSKPFDSCVNRESSERFRRKKNIL